jgi:hypothetical protein
MEHRVTRTYLQISQQGTTNMKTKKTPLNPNKACVQSQGVWKQYLLQ